MHLSRNVVCKCCCTLPVTCGRAPSCWNHILSFRNWFSIIGTISCCKNSKNQISVSVCSKQYGLNIILSTIAAHTFYILRVLAIVLLGIIRISDGPVTAVLSIHASKQNIASAENISKFIDDVHLDITSLHHQVTKLHAPIEIILSNLMD